MNRRIIKKISLFLIMFLIFFGISNIIESIADSTDVYNFSGEDSPTGSDFIKNIVGMILSAVRIVAAGVSVIVITILGTKYMSAAPTERAEIKTKLINFSIGVAVVVGATEILSILKDYAQKIK